MRMIDWKILKLESKDRIIYIDLFNLFNENPNWIIKNLDKYILLTSNKIKIDNYRKKINDTIIEMPYLDKSKWFKKFEWYLKDLNTNPKWQHPQGVPTP